MSSSNTPTNTPVDFDDMIAEEQALLAGERAAEKYDALPESNNIYDDFDLLLNSEPNADTNPSNSVIEKEVITVVEKVSIKVESTEARDPNERPELILIDVSGFLFKQYEGRKASSKKDPARSPSWYAKAPQGDAVKHGDKGVVNVDGIAGYLNFYKDKILGSFGADRVIHVLDSKTASASRKAIFPDYKKNRSVKATEYLWQDDIIEDVLLSSGEIVAIADNYEADDVIGTLSRLWMKNTGGKVLVASFDKDMTQLVSSEADENKPTVAQAIWNNGVWDIYDDDASVYKKMGVFPIQVIDLLALMGDTADGIPGAFNVGPAKATELLNTYGTIETIVANKDEIKGKLGENIRDAAPMLPIYKNLTTIRQFLKEDEVVIKTPARGNTPVAVNDWLNKLGPFPLTGRDYSVGSITPADAKKEEDERERQKELEKKLKADAKALKKANKP